MASTHKRKRRRLRKEASAAIIAACLAVAALASLLLTPMFNVKNISVQGNKSVSREEIITASGIVEGGSIFNVSLRRVRKNVEALGRVASAKVRRVWPSTISITVEEGAAVAYVLDGSSLVGLSAEGRVVGVYDAPEGFSAPIAAASASAKADKDKAKDEDKDGDERPADADEADEDSDETEETDGEEPNEADENTDGADSVAAPEEDEAAAAGRAVDRPLIVGMGKMQYKLGKTIEFSDEVKAEKLFRLLGEFLCDDICRDISYVDMSLYDNVTMLYGEGLRLSLGAADELGFKLKSFKAIMAEQLGEDAVGSLDLERMTYNPKND